MVAEHDPVATRSPIAALDRHVVAERDDLTQVRAIHPHREQALLVQAVRQEVNNLEAQRPTIRGDTRALQDPVTRREPCELAIDDDPTNVPAFQIETPDRIGGRERPGDEYDAATVGRE